jgi:MoxR-like ATPase
MSLATNRAPLRPVTNGFEDFQRKLAGIRAYLDSLIRGQSTLVEFSIASFLARGHLLLEGPPGTGKTSLARGLAGAFGGSFKRIQMTSDLLPSDIVGFLRLRPGTHEFEFREGPVFANFVLADELNRSSPKTQGALLEAMAEATVTVDGTTRRLPEPFFVIATQNPLEFHGVYPLAESQLDRFMVHLTVQPPAREVEAAIYHETPAFGPGPGTSGQGFVQSLEYVRSLRAATETVHVDESVSQYCVDLVRATRELPEVTFGVSVRGGLQLIAFSKALAFLRGRDYVKPSDVKDAAAPVLGHRICFANGVRNSEQRKHTVLGLLGTVREPR